MTNQKLQSFNNIFHKMKWFIILMFIAIIASGCTVSMQPVQSPRYFNYVEPRHNYYYWYHPYYPAPTIHIHPRPNHNHQHHGPRGPRR